MLLVRGRDDLRFFPRGVAFPHAELDGAYHYARTRADGVAVFERRRADSGGGAPQRSDADADADADDDQGEGGDADSLSRLLRPGTEEDASVVTLGDRGPRDRTARRDSAGLVAHGRAGRHVPKLVWLERTATWILDFRCVEPFFFCLRIRPSSAFREAIPCEQRDFRCVERAVFFFGVRTRSSSVLREAIRKPRTASLPRTEQERATQARRARDGTSSARPQPEPFCANCGGSSASRLWARPLARARATSSSQPRAVFERWRVAER